MEDNKTGRKPEQLNPGQTDQFGNEVTIKKNEGISDQGNEWGDKEELPNGEGVLGEKAEKYIREIADPEDMPEESDEEEKDRVMTENAPRDQMVDDDDGENKDEVIEDPKDYVPGYDLG